MNILGVNGKPVVFGGKVILPPDVVKPCTVTISSTDYGPQVYVYCVYLTADGNLVYDTTKKTLPYTFNTIQNSICDIWFSSLGGIPAIRNVVNAQYEATNIGNFIVPIGETVTCEIYNSD